MFTTNEREISAPEVNSIEKCFLRCTFRRRFRYLFRYFSERYLRPHRPFLGHSRVALLIHSFAYVTPKDKITQKDGHQSATYTSLQRNGSALNSQYFSSEKRYLPQCCHVIINNVCNPDFFSISRLIIHLSCFCILFPPAVEKNNLNPARGRLQSHSGSRNPHLQSSA